MIASDVVAKLPRVLQDALAATSDITARPARFPELTGEAFAPGVRLRRRNPARLAAVESVTRLLIYRCDRRTLRVGDQRDDGLCNGVSVERLCRHTGMAPWQVARALRDLEAAGYVTSRQPVQTYRDDEGNTRYRGFAAVRVLSPLLFSRLGISDRKLTRARAHAAAQWRARHATPASAAALLATRRAVRQAATRRPPGALPAAYSARLVALAGEHPDWPADRVRAEARRLLGL